MNHTNSPYYRDIPERVVVRPGPKGASRGYVRRILKDASRFQFLGWLALSEHQRFDFIEGSRYYQKEFQETYDGMTWKENMPQMDKSTPFHLEPSSEGPTPQSIKVPLGSILIHFSHLQHSESIAQDKLLIKYPFNFAISKSRKTADKEFTQKQQSRWDSIQIPYTLTKALPKQRLVATKTSELEAKKASILSKEFPDEICEILTFQNPENKDDKTEFRVLRMYARPLKIRPAFLNPSIMSMSYQSWKKPLKIPTRQNGPRLSYRPHDLPDSEEEEGEDAELESEKADKLFSALIQDLDKDE